MCVREMKRCPSPYCTFHPSLYVGECGLYQVTCACGWRGAWATNENMAIILWNERDDSGAVASLRDRIKELEWMLEGLRK